MASQTDPIIGPLGWNLSAGLRRQIALVDQGQFEEPLWVLAALAESTVDAESTQALKDALISVLLVREYERWEQPCLDFEIAMGLRKGVAGGPLLSRMAVHTHMREELIAMKADDFPLASGLDAWLQERIMKAITHVLGTRGGWNPLRHVRRVLAPQEYRRLRKGLTPEQAKALSEYKDLDKALKRVWEESLRRPETFSPAEFLDAERIRTEFTPRVLAVIAEELASMSD
jgi:hypothetical protein